MGSSERLSCFGFNGFLKVFGQDTVIPKERSKTAEEIGWKSLLKSGKDSGEEESWYGDQLMITPSILFIANPSVKPDSSADAALSNIESN
jgi:hypothetical protein